MTPAFPSMTRLLGAALAAGLVALALAAVPSPASAAPAPTPAGRPTAAALNYGGPPAVVLGRGPLSVRISVADGGLTHTIRVRDNRTGRTWVARGGDDVGYVLSLRKTGPASAHLTFRHCQYTSRFGCDITVGDDGVLTFVIDAFDRRAPFAWLNYPPVFRADLADGDLIFCDRSCGVLLPQTDQSYPDKTLNCYGNTAGLDMPWLGIVDRKRGDGVMVLLETPCDATLRLEPDARGRLWPRVIWRPALGRFAYPRRVSYRFSPSGGYVALAKAYRAYAAARGQIQPLRDRLAARPRVDWLRGCALVWGSKGLSFARQAHALGIRRALVYGRRPAPELRAMTDLGYLTGEYDSYTDILQGPPGFQRDDIATAAYHTADGQPVKGWRTLEGLQYYIRSSALARSRAEMYVPEVLKAFPFTARFIDVSPAIDLMEDYSPGHRFDRRADMAHRQNLLRYFSQLGLVVGGEHAKAWAVPCLDYTEGPMSGSFWWEWKAGYLIAPKARADIPKDYLRYGIDYRVRIPLYQLVFHDCIVSTWYWGDSSGSLYGIAPDLSDRKDLMNILYGTVPLMWADDKGYGWDRHRSRFLETYRDTCLFNEAVGFRELLSHEFLSADGALQRSRFAGGGEAVVNFSDEPRGYEVGKALAAKLGASRVVLAPHGFLATAPGFLQSRFEVGGEAVTRIWAPDYAFADMPSLHRVGPFTGHGRISIFAVGGGQWNIYAETGGKWTVHLDEVPGFPAGESVRVAEADEDGRPLRPFACSLHGSTLTFDAGAGPRLMALTVGPVR